MPTPDLLPLRPFPRRRCVRAMALVMVALPGSSIGLAGQAARGQDCGLAIVGPTVIDGNGGPPLADATVLIRDRRIVAVGSRASVTVPKCARVIAAAGQFLTPGFIDTNVHISLGGSMESNARYRDQRYDITLEGAQLHLKYGVTTLRDSYGILKPLLAVRDSIAAGRAVGPRLLVAGNIVGWGGFFAPTFGPPPPANLFQEQLNDEITEGTGEELILMGPDSLRAAMNRYLDKGVDFVKYGGTVHIPNPSTLVFSPRQVKVIVDETHKRGRVVETHATSPEGLLIALEAGVDLVQHPEATDVPLTDELVRLFVEKKVICSINVNGNTGKSWRDFLAERERVKANAREAAKDTSRGTRSFPKRAKTRWEIWKQEIEPEIPRMHRANAERLVKDGCVVSVATDNDLGTAPEFDKDPTAWREREPGIGTVMSIEGLVELGMTPMEALVAATKHGAIAARGLDRFGTIETGKFADLVLLTADPVADIRNIRKLRLVFRDGVPIEPSSLPVKPIYSRSLP